MGYLSQHKPVWVKLVIEARVRPKAPPDIVFRRTTATPDQWKQAKKSIASMCLSLTPRIATMRLCPTGDRQAELDKLMVDLTDRLHRSYAKSIGTIKVSSNSAPAWSPKLSAKVRRKHAYAATVHAACKAGQGVPPTLAERHRAVKRSLKSAIRSANRTRHSQHIHRTASSSQRTALMWKRSRRYSPGQTKVFGDSCTYKGALYSTREDVAQALTHKMADVHAYDPNDPD